MPQVKITLSEEDMRKAVKDYVERKYEMTIPSDCTLVVEVKSKQNYKSEWENASYRAILESII